MELRWLVGIAAAIFLLYTLSLIWFQRTKFRHQRNTKLLFEANGLSYANEAFVGGKATSPVRISYDEITGLDIAHDRQQRPVELHIKTKYQQLALVWVQKHAAIGNEIDRTCFRNVPHHTPSCLGFLHLNL